VLGVRAFIIMVRRHKLSPMITSPPPSRCCRAEAAGPKPWGARSTPHSARRNARRLRGGAEAARAGCKRLWRSDEANAFVLYRAMDGTTMLFVNFTSDPAIYVARDRSGNVVHRRADLPWDAHAQLRGPEPTPK
jgi:hypothetical protein